MSDNETKVAELKTLIADFVVERNWRQFHAPKNLAMSIAIEAAELMEHFQWMPLDESRALADDPQKVAEIGEELADVIAYSLAMANEMGIDISSALQAKMQKNVRKYPAEGFRDVLPAHDHGRNGK